MGNIKHNKTIMNTACIDNGTGTLKVGFGTSDVPAARFGFNDAKDAGATLAAWPIENGLVSNWDDMESIWSYCFENILHENPSEMKAVAFAAV